MRSGRTAVSGGILSTSTSAVGWRSCRTGVGQGPAVNLAGLLGEDTPPTSGGPLLGWDSKQLIKKQ